MRDYLKLGLTLFLICAIAAGSLAFLNSMTAPIIEEAAKQESYGKYYEVLGEVEINEASEEEVAAITEKYPEITSVLTVGDTASPTAYIFSVLSNGYGGEMENAIIIGADGSIQGYRNLKHSETPGFGKAIEEESFYSRFNEKSVANSNELVLGSGGGENEIEAISGSTVSSNGVLDGLNKAVAAYKENYAGN